MPTKSNGTQIRRLRERTGLSCRAFALQHGIDYSALWRIETGRNDGSAKTRYNIAAALGVDLDDITYEGGSEAVA